MFGIGWSEMIVILAIAVFVIGPKDLPRVLHSAGKLIRKIKRLSSDLQLSLESILQEEELAEITREANKPGGDHLQLEVERQIAREDALARETKAKSKKPQDKDVKDHAASS